LPRELERGLHSLGAAGEEIEVVQVARKCPRQLRGECFYGIVREHGAVHIGQPPGLVRERVRNFGVAVSEGGDERPAAAIEIAPTLGVDQPAPLAGHDAGERPRQVPIEDVAVRVGVHGC
jgi:hypothetical protein